MRAKIHPKYQSCTVTCACGNVIETQSVISTVRVDICGSCHPFYTGKQKFVDTAGRVDKFRQRYGKVGSSTVEDEDVGGGKS